MRKSICSSIWIFIFYVPLSFIFYLCFSLLRAGVASSPVDSSMSLSVTECNCFCQGQSIAPRQASSAGDRGCITVKLCSAYRNATVCLCMCARVCFNRNGGDAVAGGDRDLISHLTSTLTDRMARWNTAAGSKTTNHQRAKLQEAWELGQSNLDYVSI